MTSTEAGADTPRRRDLRRQMVQDQCRRRGIQDPRTLAAMERVPRHLFLPPELQGHAYGDYAVEIGQGQTISQPYVVACMTAAAGLTGTQRVLDVGTGSGYQAAVLAELAAEVFTIERIPALARAAAARLAALGYRNIHTRIGDGSLGWPDAAPFEAIVVAAGAPAAPPPLLGQLAEGGHLIMPIGPAEAQSLVRLTRRGAHVDQLDLGAVRFVPLLGAAGFTEPPEP